MTSSPSRQRGASLIESLVAMLVLALGVLGMTAAQTRALASAKATHQRTIASQAAADLLDRMQANAHILGTPMPEHPYATAWGHALTPDSSHPFVYRITAYVQGLKPGTRVWLRSVYVPRPQAGLE